MKTRFLVLITALSLCAIGCETNTGTPTATDNDQHEHEHDHQLPETYAAAVAEIEKCRDEVKDAFAAGTPSACDGALHRAADVLDKLGKLAESSQITGEDLQQVRSTSAELFGLFNEIHHGFHGGGEGASFDEVSANMETALDTLLAKIPADDQAASDDAHDHTEEHAHDDAQ